MVRHDDVDNEIGGAVCGMRMESGLVYLIDLAAKAPGEIHLCEIPFGREKISVAIAISAEAKADLERRIT